MSKSSARVVTTLKQAGGFASAQEIHQLMNRQGERIGLTTIYRALQHPLDEETDKVPRRDGGEAI